MKNNKDALIPLLNKEIKHNRIVAILHTLNMLLLIMIIIILLFYKCDCCVGGQNPDTPIGPTVFNPNYDQDIEWGERETVPIEEIKDELNKKVEQGMMNISMNTNPVFANGKAKGNLLIVNETINKYPQVVQIYRDDTGELIYESGAIPVGARIDESKLSVNLDAGVYNCTAHFNQIDENGTLLGKACAKIIVYVLE